MMEQKSICGKSAFPDFDIIYEDTFGINIEPESVSEVQNSIRESYGLEGDELKLVARLAHILPNGILCDNIAFLLRLEDGDTGMDMVDSLQKKNFIRLSLTSEGQSYISLTPEAVNAFNGYKCFGLLPEVDFIDLLRKTELREMNSCWWISQFTDKIDAHKQSDFVKGWYAIKANELKENEAKAFCVALNQFILHFTEPVKDVIGDLKPGMHIDSIGKTSVATKAEFDMLVQKGFVIIKDDGYVIAPKVADALFHGHDEIVSYDEISKLAQVIKSGDIEKRELFFSPESREEIENLYAVLSKEGFERACDILKTKKRNPAIQSLLWGGPGTGKTETVKQIARESGRDVFLFDIAKVTASDWGATENLYRSLFFSYRYIVAVMSLSPILFMNEADSALSRRLSELNRAIDKSENIVSNILLEEFENMHGIILATTNNINLLDEAFDRRFLFKTELHKPDACARKSIWKSMIPELTEEEAEFLAEEYELSGAQISNVVTKRDLAELYYRGDRGLTYIQNLIKKEMSIENNNPTGRHIGF